MVGRALVPPAHPGDCFELAQLTLLAAGTGAVLAVAMTATGVQVNAMSLALAVLLTGAVNLVEAKAVPHVAGNIRLYAGLLAGWGWSSSPPPVIQRAVLRHAPT